MLRRSCFAVTAAILLSSAPPLAAQIAWDSPPLLGTAAPSGLSLFLVDPVGGDLGGLATFRHQAGPVGLGYRFALAEENVSDDIAVSGGVDVSGYLARGMDGSEVDALWWSGLGAGVGSELLVSVPLGILFAWSGDSGDAVLSPYGGAHVALDFITGPGDTADLSGAIDLGIDVALPSNWVVRFGASLGDREAIAIGVKVGS
ncbi:MAG: hypothetical protein R3304_11630 [Longimicrobiales bacterium]|nr:hypothetical protein [Longimicrobiales bacterium]